MLFDPPMVQDLQARIDRALFDYRKHIDYQDLRQEAWLRLLQAAQKPNCPDLRRIAWQTARWAAADYFHEGHGIDADWRAISDRGFQMISTFDLSEALHPSQPDFAPEIIPAVAWRQAAHFHGLPDPDCRLLWLVSAQGHSLRAAAREMGIPYSRARDRFQRARSTLRAAIGNAQETLDGLGDVRR